MIESEINLTPSILTIKASGMLIDPFDDLNIPDGKSIAELLDDQKKE